MKGVGFYKSMENGSFTKETLSQTGQILQQISSNIPPEPTDQLKSLLNLLIAHQLLLNCRAFPRQTIINSSSFLFSIFINLRRIKTLLIPLAKKTIESKFFSEFSGFEDVAVRREGKIDQLRVQHQGGRSSQSSFQIHRREV
jgi:hypothetical protein